MVTRTSAVVQLCVIQKCRAPFVSHLFEHVHDISRRSMLRDEAKVLEKFGQGIRQSSAIEPNVSVRMDVVLVIVSIETSYFT